MNDCVKVLFSTLSPTHKNFSDVIKTEAGSKVKVQLTNFLKCSVYWYLEHFFKWQLPGNLVLI